MTPMDVVVGVGDFQDTDVWLFSAGADNPDFRAALHAARVRRAKRIKLVTRRQDAVEVLGLGGSANVAVHVIPVANEKDRPEEHTSELKSLMRISYAVFCFKKKQAG